MTNPSLKTPSLEDLIEHGVPTGPNDAYHWYNNQLWVVTTTTPDTSAAEVVEDYGVVPGQEIAHPPTRKLYVVRKSRKEMRMCTQCSKVLTYGTHYGSGVADQDTLCLACLKGAANG